MFTTREITPRQLHTPATLRAQRQLIFSSPNSAQSNTGSSANSAPTSNPPPASASQDAANLLLHISSPSNPNPAPATANDDDDEQELLSVLRNPQDDSNSTTGQQPHQIPPNAQIRIQNTSAERILPWEFEGNKFTSLYKCAPPKLTYPGGSTNAKKNNRFIKRMDMFLNKNFLVRSVIHGETPHPFQMYPRLKQYWTQMGQPDWNFNTAETFATLDAIKDKGHHTFHAELTELLWFGGVVSYGNIMAETYTIIYDFINDDDLTDVEGLCEENDGITFRKVVIRSLSITRQNHTQQIINNLYTDMDKVQLCMWIGGMNGYFSQLLTIKLKLKKHGENVSDTFLIHKSTVTIKDKHEKLDAILAELRRKSGVSGKPNSFTFFKNCLKDTFDFEVPNDCKTETV